MREGKSPFEKNSQIKLVITFNRNYFPREAPYTDNYSWEILGYVCVILSSLVYVSQAKNLSQFLLVTVNISFQGLVSALNSIGPPQGLRGSY